MAIKTDTDKFIKMRDYLNVYLDSKINELQPEYDANRLLYLKILAYPGKPYQPKGGPTWYAKTLRMKTLDEVIGYTFDFQNYQSKYENFYDDTGKVDELTGKKLNDVRIPICKEIPKEVLKDIASAMGETGSPTTIELMVEKNDTIRKYLLYKYARRISNAYAQITVDYIINKYTKDEISNWTVDDTDKVFSFGLESAITLNGKLANTALETIGRDLIFDERSYGEDSFVVLDDNPWKGSGTLLDVINDELQLPGLALKPKQPGELETGVAKPEIVQTDPPKKSGNKAKPDPSKFTITLSRFTRMWEPPREFSDGIPANSDLPEFFFFIGEEQKAAPDQLTNYSDINYEELDEEYIEDAFTVTQDIGTGPDTTVTELDLSTPAPIGGGGSYENGEGTPVAQGDQADYWAVVACCLLEDGASPWEPAQTIYNRLAASLSTPANTRTNQHYGKTLKGVVIHLNQFEVAFKNLRNGSEGAAPEWKAIESLDTAVNAVISYYRRRGTAGNRLNTPDKVKDRLLACADKIKNRANQQAARSNVGPRTGFLSHNAWNPFMLYYNGRGGNDYGFPKTTTRSGQVTGAGLGYRYFVVERHATPLPPTIFTAIS